MLTSAQPGTFAGCKNARAIARPANAASTTASCGLGVWPLTHRHVGNGRVPATKQHGRRREHRCSSYYDKSRSSWQRLPSPNGVGVSPAARFPPPRPPRRRRRCRARALFADAGGHPAAEHGGARPAGLRRRAGGPRRVRPAGHWHRDAPGRWHLRDAHPRPGSYIAASYVKFVQSAGARVVPLLYDDPEERLLEKLGLVNGVLFTGGSQKNGSYFETIKRVFQYVLDRNDAGDPFPLHAECLGFELVSMIVSKDNNILESFHALNQPSTLQFPNYSFLEGSVFQRFNHELIRKLSTDCLVMQNHGYGISPKRLQENVALSSFFKILTTSPDENGQVYVSTVQAKNYPIICTQWHPEWGEPMTPQSEDAVQVTQHFANYFVSQARKSLNRAPADKVLNNLIDNYTPRFGTSKSFDEVYNFS